MQPLSRADAGRRQDEAAVGRRRRCRDACRRRRAGVDAVLARRRRPTRCDEVAGEDEPQSVDDARRGGRRRRGRTATPTGCEPSPSTTRPPTAVADAADGAEANVDERDSARTRAATWRDAEASVDAVPTAPDDGHATTDAAAECDAGRAERRRRDRRRRAPSRSTTCPPDDEARDVEGRPTRDRGRARRRCRRADRRAGPAAAEADAADGAARARPVGRDDDTAVYTPVVAARLASSRAAVDHAAPRRWARSRPRSPARCRDHRRRPAAPTPSGPIAPTATAAARSRRGR